MPQPTLSSRPFRLKATTLVALWAIACGGSAVDVRGSGGAGSSGGAVSHGGAGSSGSGASHGGSVGYAGAVSYGGAGSSGGNACDVGCPLILCNGISVLKPGDCCPTCEPSGGASSGGGTGICDLPCIGIGCGPGFKQVTEPGACCPSCVPDGSAGTGGSCAAVDCAAYDCAPGYTLEYQPGACCPTCVPNNACTTGQSAYKALKAALLNDSTTTACMTSADCTVLAGDGSCNDGCAQTPVNKTAAASLGPQLQEVAKSLCSTCKPIYPPCAAPLPPTCFNHTCMFVEF